MKIIILVAIALMIASISCQANPSLSVIIDHTIIDQYKATILPQFESDIVQKLQSLTFPTFSDSKSEFFFTTSVEVSNTQITTFDFDTDQIFINFLSNQNGVTNGIAIIVNNFNIVVNANCQYSAGFISDSGNLNAQSYGSSMQIYVEIDAQNGQLTANVVNMNINLNDFSVSISGDLLNDIVNWIIGMFQGNIQDAITNAFNNEKTTLTNAIQKVLVVPTVIPFKNYNISMFLELTQVSFTPTYMQVSASSYFFNRQKTQSPPPIAGPVPMNYQQPTTPTSNSSAIDATILFSEYLIQSFFYAAQDSNSLNFNFTKNLNMQLIQNYTDATILIKSLSMPTISVSQQQLTTQLNSLITIYFGPILFLNCTASASATLQSSPSTQQLNITSLDVSNIQVQYTQWNELNSTVLQILAEKAFNGQIEKLNQEINYIHLNNPYLPFSAILPRIVTQNSYFQLNVESDDMMLRNEGIIAHKLREQRRILSSQK